MRAFALAAALLSSAVAAGQIRTVKPNVYGKKKAYVSPYLYEKRPVDFTGDCAGSSPPSGISLTRASTATCPKADGTVVSVASGLARLTSRGMLRENAATNLILHSRDMSQGAWLKTNMTCTRTATGTDGSANTATTCTAGAANATVLQGVTASGSRNSSFYIKRRTGSGTVEVTRDGSTWLTVALSTSWQRFSMLTHAGLTGSVTNPVLGVRLATSGDAVDIDRVQDEVTTIPSMPIDTAGSSATRAADLFSFPTPPALLTAEGCAYVCMEPEWTGATPATVVALEAPGVSGRSWFFWSATGNIGGHQSITAPTVAAAFVVGGNKCYMTAWSATAGTWRAHNVTAGTAGTALSYATQMVYGASMYVGSQVSGGAGVNAFFTALRLHTTATGCGA